MKMASEVNSVIKNCYIDKPIKIDSDHLIIQDCHVVGGSEGITFERGSATNNEEAPISNPKNGEVSLADQVRAELISLVHRDGYVAWISALRRMRLPIHKNGHRNKRAAMGRSHDV
jgi:hypothetical protein